MARAKQIYRPMTVDKAREYFRYDSNTGVLTWAVDRTRWPIGTRAGSIDTKGHRRVFCEGRSYAATTIIWMIVHGRKPNGMIDHSNRVPDDDRLVNLREATGSQNCMNRPSSGAHPKGVICHKGRFIARITKDRRTRNLGSFDTEEEASAAYKEAARHLHGEFCYFGGNHA